MKRKILVLLVPILLCLGMAQNANALTNTLKIAVANGNIIITDSQHTPQCEGHTFAIIDSNVGMNELRKDVLPLVNGKATISLRDLGFDGSRKVRIDVAMEIRVGPHSATVGVEYPIGVLIGKDGKVIRAF